MRLLLALSCVGCSTHAQHRAALVPHAAPVQAFGQRAAWRGTASIAATNIGDFVEPGPGDATAGIAVPSKQLRGALSLAITRRFTIGMFREQGLVSSAQAISGSLPPLPDRSLVGMGYTASYSIETGTPWRIGLAIEIGAWDVPWVAYSTCIENCTSTKPVRTEGSAGVLSFAAGIVPSYQLGDLTFFAGVTVRNHPTLEEKVVNHGEDPYPSSGPANVLVHAGVAYELADRVQLVVETHDELTAFPVNYAAGVGASLAIGLGRRYPRHALPEPTGPREAPAADPEVERRAIAGELTDQARRDATRGDCEAVRATAARVQAVDAEYYAHVFAHDVLIAACEARL